MKKLRWLLAASLPILALGLLGSAGCGRAKDPWDQKGAAPRDQGGPVRVVVSFAPLDSFVCNVAGPHAAVHCLCSTTGPHDYQFNVQDCLWLKTADLLLVNGFGLDEGFTDKLNANSGNNKLRYVKVAPNIPPVLRKKNTVKHAGHDHGEFDPHVWLGLPQSIKVVESIRDNLKDIDPAHADIFNQNAAAYVKKLEALQNEGKEKLAKLKAPIITVHESMGYFADNFALNVTGAIQPSAGIEPDGRRLAELLGKCKGEELVIIAREPQYSDANAETLKRELLKHDVKQVVIVTIDPMETANAGEVSAEWYINKMRANIDTLANLVK